MSKKAEKKTGASFKGLLSGKRVLVTGHTGFKGSWLTAWLLELGAEVVGFSIDVPTEPSNFEVLGLGKKVRDTRGDVRDLAALKKVFDEFRPEVVFHLAAQAITRLSYDKPQETFLTNLGGTVNVLECVRTSGTVRAAVMITSDKCYENVEWIWGYRENDRVGGEDPYSASKGCAELAASSYMRSFFRDGKKAVATARAGNVIGGGDWAVDRIVPDCVRSRATGKVLELRSPRATRPWQHVLEPLGGYLHLASRLIEGEAAGESFNFGPRPDVDRPVEELVRCLAEKLDGVKWKSLEQTGSAKKEANLLRLNCDKAAALLGWSAVLDFDDTVAMTANWYAVQSAGSEDMFAFTTGQIRRYSEIAAGRGLPWAKGE